MDFEARHQQAGTLTPGLQDYIDKQRYFIEGTKYHTRLDLPQVVERDTQDIDPAKGKVIEFTTKLGLVVRGPITRVWTYYDGQVYYDIKMNGVKYYKNAKSVKFIT